jgi:hypothetical protein
MLGIGNFFCMCKNGDVHGYCDMYAVFFCLRGKNIICTYICTYVKSH